MASRSAILATLLGASIGVPYVVSQATSEGDGTSKSASKKPRSTYAQQYAAGSATGHQPSSAGQSVFGSATPIPGTPVYPLAEVLRLDVSKDWVYAHWARKSTGLADPALFGVRVPLVTGTAMSDLAGSLSYYFNAQGRVQHISFRGQTGDTSQIVGFLAQRYNFRPAAGARPGEQLFQVRCNGKVQSELRTLPVPVLWSSKPHQSFMVELELERPGSCRYIERPLPPLTLPSSTGVETLHAKSEPQKPTPVGPVSWFQQINNTIIETADPTGGASPSSATSKTPSAASPPPPVEIPRPPIHWPG